jgi:hypothetical protein
LDLLKKPENAAKLREVLFGITGTNFNIKAKVVGDSDSIQKNAAESLIAAAKANNIQIEKLN